MTARKALNLGALDALDARATPGPWRVVLDDTEGPTTVWQACTSPQHTEEVDPDRNTVYDCCTDGGLHGEPFFREADAEFVATARTALPELVAEVRRLRALVRRVISLTKTTDGDELEPDVEIPVGELYRVLYVDEPGTTDPVVAEFKAGMAEAVRQGLLAEFGERS